MVCRKSWGSPKRQLALAWGEHRQDQASSPDEGFLLLWDSQMQICQGAVKSEPYETTRLHSKGTKLKLNAQDVELPLRAAPQQTSWGNMRHFPESIAEIVSFVSLGRHHVHYWCASCKLYSCARCVYFTLCSSHLFFPRQHISFEYWVSPWLPAFLSPLQLAPRLLLPVQDSAI